VGLIVVTQEGESGFRGQFLDTMRAQALQRGLAPDTVCNRYTMRLELG
jgi:hypothetical protein